MDSIKEYWWRIGLELKVRQLSGDAFQDFFGRIMQARYGDDYVRVRPYGQRGDKGCDGYLASSGRVYQCYGAVNGDGSKVDYLVDKMGVDFAKARDALKAIMKEWHMVHNLVDGLPIDAVETLRAIEKAMARWWSSAARSNSIACAVELEKRMVRANDGVPDERHIILLRPPAMSASVPLLEAQPTSGH
jgi:hypothetical protein